MSEMSARASRRALAAGSWLRNGLGRTFRCPGACPAGAGCLGGGDGSGVIGRENIAETGLVPGLGGGDAPAGGAGGIAGRVGSREAGGAAMGGTAAAGGCGVLAAGAAGGIAGDEVRGAIAGGGG